MVIFHSYVSLPEGIKFRSHSWMAQDLENFMLLKCTSWAADSSWKFQKCAPTWGRTKVPFSRKNGGKIQWIGLRENLNRKPSNFPLNIRGFRFQFSRKNQSIKPIRLTVAIYPWIGLRENLQESPMIFMWKIYGFL